MKSDTRPNEWLNSHVECGNYQQPNTKRLKKYSQKQCSILCISHTQYNQLLFGDVSEVKFHCPAEVDEWVSFSKNAESEVVTISAEANTETEDIFT